ncbi:putative endopeptidase [Sphingopyxis panaciterrae]|uniref:M13 family metallopeptidase n=1 Tax=Sphingopyxis panaciterrae TaxID=363841 RepID=UPI001420C976|nr:M13 family metallopeptidase [Sphingopyxis panaciterrae]NIJ36674.1 putative endopeptidase [Sphingopyxis panaciterrae]
MRSFSLAALLAGTMLPGVAMVCAQEVPPARVPAPAPTHAKAQIGTFGFDEAGMDRSVKPGDDFFAYAVGTWYKNTPIPADKPAWGSYIQLQDETDTRIRGLLQAAQADPANKLGRAYASYLDTSRVEALGLEPIRPWLDRIKGLNDRKGYSALVADADEMKIGGPVAYWVWQDDRQPTRAMLMIEQAGLGMGDRSLYLSQDPGVVAIRTAYTAHLARLLTLAGEPDADARAQAVMALETEIANVHWVREDAIDMVKTYHKFTIAQTADFSTPTFDFQAILKCHAPRVTEVQIREPSAVKSIAAIVDKAPLAVLKDQLLLRSLDGFSEALPERIENESFAFFGTALAGTPQQPLRWRRAAAFATDALRDEVGKAYVARYFPPRYKAELTQLVDNMKAVLHDRIDRLEWMQHETKLRAKEKLRRLTVRIGYPDKWRDYSTLEMRADDRFGNRVRANRFDFRYMMDRASEPTRSWEWGYVGAHVVDANANYNLLQLTFPAAFLQAPNFDPGADPAINYGAVGAIVAHEITHNFDNTGAKYNEDGIQTNWWTPQDVEAFEAAGNALVAQYDKYEVLPGLNANGRVSLGENISDLAGLTIAFEAYERTLGGKPAPVINGLTGEQRFFLGWAQFFRIKPRDEYLRQYVRTWQHSPDRLRVLTVRNIDAWYKAFDVKPGDKLYLPPEQRVKVW